MRSCAAAVVLAIALTALAAGQALAAAPVYTEAAHSGTYYGATSTTRAGGGAYEDMALSTAGGNFVCASAWVRSQFPATGASGSFVVWLIGGTRSEAGSARYSGLGNLGSWTQVHTCVEATTSHTGLRVQFYPTPGGPTVDMDDIDVHQSLAVNGGFENGGGPWAPYPNTGSNFAVYQSPTAHSGSHLAATNTTGAGGGIYEDVPLGTSPGQVVCGSAWVRTEAPAAGASGSFVVWLIGGSRSEAGSARYSGLGNGSNWVRLQTCTEATVSHTALRVQFYPNIGSPTVEIDDVDVHDSLAVNGGFENGAGPWAPWPNTNSNFAVVQSSNAHSGSQFAATNTTGAGGGIYEDVPLGTSPGQLVCGSAWVRTEAPATGASGSFVIWLLGGSGRDASTARYSRLGNGNWAQLQTCTEATVGHTSMRVQFYPNPGSPTVEIDDVDVHESLAANGGFEFGSGPWSTYPNTNSTYDAFAASQVQGPTPPGVSSPGSSGPVMSTPVATQLPRPTARHALKVKISIFWTWRHRFTWIHKVRIGRFPARMRLTVRCAGRGCPLHSRTATGKRHVHHLLRSLQGRRFRAGDVLRITLTAPGFTPERVKVRIRDGKLPRMTR